MASLQAAKQRLRLIMKQKLESIPAAAIQEQSNHILKSLGDFKPYVEAKSISLFLSMPGGEVQTDPIVRHAFASGKEVFVPYLHRNPDQPSADSPVRVMDMVRLRSLRDYEDLKPDRWGIPSIEPTTVHERQRILGGPDAHGSSTSVLDLVLMPGVAFDIDPDSNAVRRLGHGKGFYDFFIHRYRLKLASLGKDGHSTQLYGLALVEQLVSAGNPAAVPVGPLDQRLDGLIVGNGEIRL